MPSSPSTTPRRVGASSTPSLPPRPSTTRSNTTSCSRTRRPSKQAGRPDVRAAEHRRRLLAAGRRQRRREADPGRPAAGAGRQQARPRAARRRRCKRIIDDYNARFGTNHRIEEFDLYYQDVQKRIKDQQFPNADLPKNGREKLDITIVVDMLLTGFDSKYLNTLYVDKNLKHHGLIQAFSRTNRVLNDTKPYGHILDFRGQQDAVDDGHCALLRRQGRAGARDLARGQGPRRHRQAQGRQGRRLDDFMQSQGLAGKPEDVREPEGRRGPGRLRRALQGGAAAANPARPYTDLTPEQKADNPSTCCPRTS